MTIPPGGLPPLRDAFRTADRKRDYVRRLFSTIADRYDLITVLLSFGLDRGWKRRLVSLAGAGSGAGALDLACGTGDIAALLADAGMRVTALDVTPRMLELARVRDRAGALRLVAGDMMALPFPDASFDLVTCGYGVRNVPAIEPALREIFRVLKPGGQFLSLDFNRPDGRALRAVYLGYLTAVGSALGLVLHRNPDTYRYIPESIRRYPGADRVCDLARAQGFDRCEWVPVLGGLMAVHRAVKEAPAAQAPEARSVTLEQMELDAAGWSGEGAFTQLLVDALRAQPAIGFVKVEDAPASRSDAAFSFISNEVFVAFKPDGRAQMTISMLSSVLESLPGIGAPDYADDGMIQYLRTERVIPPYQTRGYKLIELVRIYRAG